MQSRPTDKQLDLPSHTISENRSLWDNYDWSQSGEEWNLNDVWKSSMINGVMLKYIKGGSTILEIGPGAGRWTETLVGMADKLILADISKKCLAICKDRFKKYDNIKYILTEGNLDLIQDNSIDYIWSYDVFVHINPTDIRLYLQDIQRVLRPKGISIIHHSGRYDKATREKHFRSYMTGEMFANLITENGMLLIEQNSKSVHIHGDIISVFTKF